MLRATNLVLADVWDEREELICVCKADEDDKDRSRGDGDENHYVRTTSLLRGKISRTDAKSVRADVHRGA